MGGPFPNDELWCRLNAWVIAQWAKNTAKTEEDILRRFAEDQLGLSGEDVIKFSLLCLQSADAVLLGKLSLEAKISPWWSRDDTINTPNLPEDARLIKLILEEKAESVSLWRNMVSLAEGLEFPDKDIGRFVRSSARYGLELYQIYQAIFVLRAIAENKTTEDVHQWLKQYDDSWDRLNELCKSKNSPATPYFERGSSPYATGKPIEHFIAEIRGGNVRAK